MAQFEVISQEGMQFVKVTLQDDSFRAEAGALSYMTGNIAIKPQLPLLGGMIRSFYSGEAMVRPFYRGTGVVYLESSFNDFYVFDLGGEAWILNRGTYWASDNEVHLTYNREPMLASFWTGEGIVGYRTKVSGRGKVVLSCAGPVEERRLKNERVTTEADYVIARTEGIRYTVRRVTTFFRSLFSGESMVRSYEGTGRVLIAAIPLWRAQLAKKLGVSLAPDAAA
jgi:uncharacterized protein (AIM24 family)